MHTRAHKDGFHRARAIEIGDEPPLRIDGEDPGSSRSVNIRWFASTVLAGALGILLLGTAIVTSMEGSYNLATPGVFAQWDPYGGRPARGTNANRKGDQIAQMTRGVDDARQIFRVSTTTRDGAREIVRTRPVTRITAGLMASGIDVEIPAFNPLAMVADNDDADPVEGGGEALPATDGEIAYTVKNLADVKLSGDEGPSVPLDEVLAAVRDTASIESMNTADFQQFGDVAASPGAETASLGSLPMPGANMTVIAKTVKRNNDAGGDENERIVTARPNDRLDALLMRQGATQQEAREITAAFGAQSGYGTMGLLAGQQVKILMVPTGPRLQPVRVIVAAGTSEAIVALSDTGGYVAVADAPEIAQEGEEVATAEASGRDGDLSLYQSFYGTAVAKGVPKPVIDELVKVFGYDADFQRKVGGGDSFEVLFGSDDAGQIDGPPEVMFCTLTSGGETRRYYRYQSAEDGAVDYYDEEGRSARKFLTRKPIAQAVMRSGFGLRRHPVLGYSKMHTGVDWAAPRGTPIYAAGSGVVELAERNGGYGNQIKIQHANGYETAYGHMSGFAKGMKPGLRVRQGQVIGYVGSTGLSTGPHVHYEVLVNGRFVNPMRIKVPRGREIEGPALAEFHRERERIDAVVGRGPTGGSAQLTQSTRGGG